MVPDFFASARGREAWETFSPLIITEENVNPIFYLLYLLSPRYLWRMTGDKSEQAL